MDKVTNDMQVHAAHCCKAHGCKYWDKDCPVISGKILQLYACEDCDNDNRRIDAAMEVAIENNLIADTPENRAVVLSMINAADNTF